MLLLPHFPDWKDHVGTHKAIVLTTIRTSNNKGSRRATDGPRSVSNLYRVASVNSDSLAIQVLARNNEQNGRSHIAVVTRSLRRQTLLSLLGHLRLLIVVSAIARSHLRGEDTRRNTVDADLDTILRNLSREHLIEVDGGTLASVVREVVLRDPDVARDTADIDNGSGVALMGLSRLLDQGKEGGAHEERADDVGLVDVEPFLLVGRF